MKFILDTSAYEKDISKIIITDEESTNPLMLLDFKDGEIAEDYFDTLSICLKFNNSSTEEKCKIKPFNFNVVQDSNKKSLLLIYGNIINALDFMASDKKISDFTYKNMIMDDEDPQFQTFIAKNKEFKLHKIANDANITKLSQLLTSTSSIISKTSSTHRNSIDSSSISTNTTNSGNASAGSTPPDTAGNLLK